MTTEPFETVRDAMAAAKHIYAMPPGTGAWTEANLRLLEDACDGAGRELGAYERHILAWLAGWEPSTCVVVARLINPGGQQAAAAKSSSEGERDG